MKSNSIKQKVVGLLTLFSLAVLSPLVLSPLAKADEAAEKILARARFNATLQSHDLHGHMKKNGLKTPVSLFLRGKNIQFYYKEKGKEKRFHMRLNDDKFDLFDIVDGKTKRFDDKKLNQRINNTDMSFEDLSMRFLYWKNSTVVGKERVNGQKCDKIRLINPTKAGDYKIVYAWVHEKYGALMKVVGYNAKGQPLKQFQVTDLMRVGREYTLKRMRVDTYNPNTNKSIGVTYLEFQKPKKVTK